MLDFVKEETSQKTMTANVILTFDTIINEFGTQEIFDVEFAVLNSGENKVLSMLYVIKCYMESRGLPENKLWKISTAANWTKFANETGMEISIIQETNGKWQFLNADHWNEFEKLMHYDWGFGIDV